LAEYAKMPNKGPEEINLNAIIQELAQTQTAPEIALAA
jgi:hypothetical protein